MELKAKQFLRHPIDQDNPKIANYSNLQFINDRIVFNE